MTCRVCEAHPTESPLTIGGLCAWCAEKPTLRAHFLEGQERRAGWNPLAGWLNDSGEPVE